MKLLRMENGGVWMDLLILAERLGPEDLTAQAWNALVLSHGVPFFLLVLSLLFFIPRSHLRRVGLARLIAYVFGFSADALFEVSISRQFAQMITAMDVSSEISLLPYSPLPVIGMSLVWLIVGYGFACFLWGEELEPKADGSVPELPWSGLVVSVVACLLGHAVTTFFFSMHATITRM
ncbi:MAG: hypothetical protein HS116_08435 [Planctomycetes bacterium]|nr:hypothetical protein [Planctomycetota bacterium]